MRILYQLTSPMEKTALGAPEVARRREFLRARAAGADVDVRSLCEGPASIESEWEAALVVPELCDAVQRAHEVLFYVGQVALAGAVVMTMWSGWEFVREVRKQRTQGS